MRYFGNPSTAVVREAMRRKVIGGITTPYQGNLVPVGAWWCADSGCFGAGFPGEDQWFRWLHGRCTRYHAKDCEFATAPDVVGDAKATLERSAPWLPRIRDLGLPAALVAQDGLTVVSTPWSEFDVLFIGGTTEFKLGRQARELAAHARWLGKNVHMGRVNSRVRLQYAHKTGCTSVDGTYLSYGPAKNLVRMTRWLDEVNRQPLLGE